LAVGGGEQGREKKREENAAAGGSLLSGGGRGRGGGPGVDAAWRKGMGKTEGGPGTAWDSAGCATTADSGPAATRAGGVAWPRRATGRTGEGEGVDRWSVATVPGGGTS
jgi:hypothetical protein